MANAKLMGLRIERAKIIGKLQDVMNPVQHGGINILDVEKKATPLRRKLAKTEQDMRSLGWKF